MHTEADGEPPAHDSEEWKAWLLAELGTPRSGPRGSSHLPPDAEETLGMFKLARDEREEFDREAFGAFVLSMTRSVADILGAYLLAKEARSLHDAARVEACTLPITPLFETIHGFARRARRSCANCWPCRWCGAAPACRAACKK